MEHYTPKETLPEVELARRRVAPLYEQIAARNTEINPLRMLIDECIERARQMDA